MEEIWVKIDNVHLVSNQGRVYSERSKSIIGCYNKVDGRFYIMYNKQTTPIHVLVAKAFPEICGYWFNGCVVHHKNFNKLDNRAENLQVMTRKEHQKIHNMGVKRSKETCKNIKQSLIGKGLGHNNSNTKTILQLSPFGETIKEWSCIKECCEELNLNYNNILVMFSRQHSNIINYNGYLLKK